MMHTTRRPIWMEYTFMRWLMSEVCGSAAVVMECTSVEPFVCGWERVMVNVLRRVRPRGLPRRTRSSRERADHSLTVAVRPQVRATWESVAGERAVRMLEVLIHGRGGSTATTRPRKASP